MWTWPALISKPEIRGKFKSSTKEGISGIISTRLASNLPKEIKDALGEPNLAERLRGNSEDINESFERVKAIMRRQQKGVEAIREVEGLKETMDEREEEYMKQYRLLTDSNKRESKELNRRIDILVHERNDARRNFDRAVRDIGDRDAELRRVTAKLEASVMQERRLNAEIIAKEEQLRQTTQAIEDLEHEMDRRREIIEDHTRAEREREAAQAQIGTLEERVAELQAHKEGLEKELGLTTKEKVKRFLMKYGIPLAFAVAISSVVGVILSTLNAAGKGAKAMGKKLGNGLTDL
ncbi:tropomyosin-like, partial [Actinia tenebrosa]|uniref:Tropomyosin-like n=1 Tax=Actinia tenebrosa TaxID=6105 RepID=A0A6P8HR41_ACTTE